MTPALRHLGRTSPSFARRFSHRQKIISLRPLTKGISAGSRLTGMNGLGRLEAWIVTLVDAQRDSPRAWKPYVSPTTNVLPGTAKRRGIGRRRSFSADRFNRNAPPAP